jgi:immune inhibitor A
MNAAIGNNLFNLMINMMVLAIMPVSALSVPLSDEALIQMEQEGRLGQFINSMKEARERGLDKATKFAGRAGQSMTLADNGGGVDTVRVLVLLVDFNDNPFTAGAVAGAPGQFDSLLFSTDGKNPTGSMTEYYLENSYGKFHIIGDVHGWLRMPQNYSFYVGSSYGLGTFPHSSKMLVLDAIAAADSAGVDFSRYDLYDNDGYMDGLFIVHAGPGHEESGAPDDMHSHKWNLGQYKISVDGITIDDYTVEPEESYAGQTLSHIGVFCHEYGHILGLPDLYDVRDRTNTSLGLGKWSLMATGCYNGGSRRPAHLDAWSKVYLGFVQPLEVFENMTGAAISEIETSPVIYKLWAGGDYNGDQYFLVENRRANRFDAALPGQGLLIYHVDESAGDVAGNNDDPERYHVALEQADGLYQIEYTRNNSGDNGDPFPGSTGRRNFDDASTPNSRAYGDIATQVAIWNISDSDSVMTANFDVRWSRPKFELTAFRFDDADDDGWLEAGERVECKYEITNKWLTAKDVFVTLSASNAGLDDDIPVVYFPVVTGDGGRIDNEHEPIVFVMPDSVMPTYASFTLAISNRADSILDKFTIERTIGHPQVLLVDADRGAAYEEIYLNDFHSLKTPVAVWDYKNKGIPPAHYVDDFRMMVWFTGDTASNLISQTDLMLLTNYLDGGGALFLTGQWLASELAYEDRAFLNNYLHADIDGSCFNVIHEGMADNPIGNNLVVRYTSYANQDWEASSQIAPVNGGAAVFRYDGGGYSAVSFAGEHKTVFFNWGYEALSDMFATYDKRVDVLQRIIAFLGGQSPDIYNGSPFVPLPKDISLGQNFPNPFNPTTTIVYELNPVNQDRETHVVLSIFNILGRRVRTLVDGEQSAGRYTVIWDGTDESGLEVASGVYFYRLNRGGESESKKMILLK